MADGTTTGLTGDIEADFLASATADFVEAEKAGAQAGEAAAQAENAQAEEAAQITDEPVEDQPDSLLAQDEVDKSTDEVEVRAQEAAEPNGAQKRIKQLAAQKNELKAQLQETQKQFQQQMAYMQQQIAAQQAESAKYARQQNSLLQKQLEMLSSRATNEQIEKMSPLEKHDYELKQRVSKELESKLYEELAPLKGQLEAERRARAEAEQRMEQQKRYNHYNELTKKARQEVLLKELPATDAEPLSSDAEETLLAYAAAYGIEPMQAAPKFKKFLDSYARAYINAKAAAGKKQVTKQQSVPGVSRPTAPKAGKPRLTLQEIRKQGYTDFVEYYANQPLEG